MLIFIGVTMLIFSSCKKTCECTKKESYYNIYSWGTETLTSTESIVLEEGEKCSDFNYSNEVEGIAVICKAEY